MAGESAPSHLQLTLDRELPVSIQAQLIGQIEYGVSSGRLAPGSQLPSIRDLAESLEISPVTVSHAYRTLRDRELIESVPGRGTFVTRDLGRCGTAARHLPTLHRAVDELIAVADRLEVSREELSGLVALRLQQDSFEEPHIRILFVGIFREATHDYGRHIRQHLGAGCSVQPAVFDDLEADPAAASRRVGEADLLLTIAHRRKDLERLAPDGAKIGIVRFIPSQKVRVQLAELSPTCRTGLVSKFPEFLPTFLEDVASYTRHVERIRGTVLGAPDLGELIAASDVVIYSTGSDAVLEKVPPRLRCFEYRHVPDPVSLENDVLPLLHDVREQLALFRRSPASATPAAKESV